MVKQSPYRALVFWLMGHALFTAESFGRWNGDGVAGGQQAGEERAESKERGRSTVLTFVSPKFAAKNKARLNAAGLGS